jgi:hypothetical protein
MQATWALEMWRYYLELLGNEWRGILLTAAVGLGFMGLWLRQPRPAWLTHLARWRPLGALCVACALAIGLWLAVERASVFDDAFISFRYARNLLEGHGLVWNPGERVEGYTNFLWTVMLAGAAWLLPLELPLLGLLGCLLAYSACVVALGCLERRVLGLGVPIGTVLFALQNWAIDYATTGMETELALLWVLLGMLALIRGATPRDAALAGLAFIAATFTRPDHGLFWAAGGLTLAALLRDRYAAGWRRWLPPWGAWTSLLAYGASFAPYAAYLVWRYSYYGHWMPNTYLAKSGGDSYWTQGALYGLSFVFGDHLWLLLPMAALGLAASARDHRARALRIFCALALPVYVLYVLKVGGDFMVGRFFVVTLPLWLLLAHRGLRSLVAQHSRWALAGAAMLCASLGGVEIVAQGPGHWYLSHEPSHYRVTQWFPEVVIHHHNYRGGHRMKELLADRGIRPVIATSGIGMMGYYSGLELIDSLGLTDRRIAKTSLKHRGMPGHEKKAPQRYLDRRDVLLIRKQAYVPKRWSRATTVDLGIHKRKDWHLNRYDPEFIEQLKRLAPEVGFQRFEPHIDRWLQRAGGLEPRIAAQDVAFFERYYFSCNDDPERRELVARALERCHARALEATEQPDAYSPTETDDPPTPPRPAGLLPTPHGSILAAPGARSRKARPAGARAP